MGGCRGGVGGLYSCALIRMVFRVDDFLGGLGFMAECMSKPTTAGSRYYNKQSADDNNNSSSRREQAGRRGMQITSK